MLLHDLQELDDDLRRGADQHLALSTALCIDDGIKRIVEDGNASHLAEYKEPCRYAESGVLQGVAACSGRSVCGASEHTITLDPM